MKRLLILLAGVLAAPAYAECTPTRSMPMGTHHEPITRETTNIGTGLLVEGRILGAPDCRPLPGAKISHWQAGEAGRYLDRLRAYQFSDRNGGYRFETEWPALSVPHIHFIVEAEGYETLVTQWVGNEHRDRITFDLILPPR